MLPSRSSRDRASGSGPEGSRFESSRDDHGELTGRAAGPALKAVRAQAHVDRNHNSPPIGKVNRTGSGGARKAPGTERYENRALGLPPWKLNRSGLRPPFEADGHRQVWRSTRQASAILLRADRLVIQVLPYATLSPVRPRSPPPTSRVCRELENPAGRNPAPLCCAGSNPCQTHHADIG